MPAWAEDVCADNLHEATSRLNFWLNELAANPTKSTPASPRQMAGVLSELMRAGDCLRGLPAERDLKLQEEVNDYRRTVERLRESMPAIQRALLRDRARLEQERGRVVAAAEWAQRSRQTL
jgi:hypothetical protein